MIFAASVPIFFVPEDIIFDRTMNISGTATTVSGSEKIIFISEKIISGMKKIFSALKTSFFAAEMIFLAGEKTARGAAPALFLTMNLGAFRTDRLQSP